MHVKLVQAALFLLGAGLLGLFQPAAPVLHPGPLVMAEYASADQPLPLAASPNVDSWEKSAKQVFMYVRGDNVDGFLRLVSSQGLWIEGLSWHPDLLHVTPTELSVDLHSRGRLYQAIFLDHRSGNFVETPDAAAHVQCLILK